MYVMSVRRYHITNLQGVTMVLCINKNIIQINKYTLSKYSHVCGCPYMYTRHGVKHICSGKYLNTFFKVFVIVFVCDLQE